MEEIDLLITAGDGPVECRIALAALLLEIEREAREAACDIHVTKGPCPDRHGPKSAVVSLSGAGAARVARAFAGTIRYVFKSPVRPHHKRQNWFVGVTCLHANAAPDASLDLWDVRFETLRAGGPGGQHQNTTDSAVRATHLPTGLAVLSRNQRSQHQNKKAALARLSALLRALHENVEDANRVEIFHAKRELERGNAVRTFRLSI